jgi:drug/metabolite transporter (DMT)-like permease
MPPIFTASISTLFAALFFAVIVTVRKQWHQVRFAPWKYILWTTFFIGILFYGLLFGGMKFTTAGNAGIVALMEIFFAFVIFSLFLKKESRDWSHILGATLMVGGALFILFPGEVRMNWGDGLILLATFFAPFGNHFQQKARKKVSTPFLLFFRSIFSSIFLFGFAYFIGEKLSYNMVEVSLLFLFINGFLLLGLSTIFWVEAIHHIRVSKAISLHTFAPALTLVFAYFFLQEVPTAWQIVGFVPIIAGSFFILRSAKNN